MIHLRLQLSFATIVSSGVHYGTLKRKKCGKLAKCEKAKQGQRKQLHCWKALHSSSGDESGWVVISIGALGWCVFSTVRGSSTCRVFRLLRGDPSAGGRPSLWIACKGVACSWSGARDSFPSDRRSLQEKAPVPSIKEQVDVNKRIYQAPQESGPLI